MNDAVIDVIFEALSAGIPPSNALENAAISGEKATTKPTTQTAEKSSTPDRQRTLPLSNPAKIASNEVEILAEQPSR